MGSGNMDEEYCRVDILNWLIYCFALEFRNYLERLHMCHVHFTTLPMALVLMSEVQCYPLLRGASWWLWSQRWTSPEGRRHPKALHDGRRSTSEMPRGSVWNDEQTTCSAPLEQLKVRTHSNWVTPVVSMLWLKIVFHHAEDSTCRTDDEKHVHTWDKRQLKINQPLNGCANFCQTNWQHVGVSIHGVPQ